MYSRHIRCTAEEVDWNYLALQTETFSGAELRTVINEAPMIAVRQRGSEVKQHHLIQAVQKVQHMKSALSGASPHHPGIIVR